jgi:hypothetical protein
MKIKNFLFVTGLIALILISGCGVFLRKGPEAEILRQQKQTESVLQAIQKCLQQNAAPNFEHIVPPNSKVDSVRIAAQTGEVKIYLSKHFSFQPFRPQSVQQIYALFQNHLPKNLRKNKLQIFALELPIEELIPNFFREHAPDSARLPLPEAAPRIPLVRNVSHELQPPANGLFAQNIVVAHSHGWYYSHRPSRWEWQRPRMFSKVEDLLPFSFCISYLIPMLEQAGANVFVSRERDFQIQEVIVDNDYSPDSTGHHRYFEHDPNSWQTSTEPGFATGSAWYFGHFNPFVQGTHRLGTTVTAAGTKIEWIPEIPETGEYSVSVTYVAAPENTPTALYRVFHAGGQTDFQVNQQIGGKTWVYLGKFKFFRGVNPQQGSVVLTSQNRVAGQKISADAVRFGGGMGNIVRGGATSGYPRYAEGSRYSLQQRGMPDSLVYSITGDKDDYVDDYVSRSEYANYLKGAPFGPNGNRATPGLKIPVDAYLSFHTDAGILPDSTVGTLMIYRILDEDTLANFPDGVSRLANRDLADLVQTEIVTQIRAKYDPRWTRRALMDGNYSEARRPNMPACLLELLSHQNFTDMKYALNPRFRFDVARAIYKGMLKFLATQRGQKFVVAPLPVSHFRTYFSAPGTVTLAWRPVLDTLETTAAPDKYLIYTRVNDGGFDPGRLAHDTTFVIQNLQPGVIYSFRVAALNAGGESFPSEILSVCWNGATTPQALIVNGFDRTAAPAAIDESGFKGFLNFLDEGVGDAYDFGYTGAQIDFFPPSPWRTNDAPGHGAGMAYYESQIIAGNNFDYPFVHGQALRAGGRSFVSCSDEAFSAGLIATGEIGFIDLILGEEKPTLPENPKAHPGEILFQPFYPALQQQVIEALKQGKALFVSGAYVGESLMNRTTREDSAFARDWLKIDWQTHHASRSGVVFAPDSSLLPRFDQVEFITEPNPRQYAVESPEAINPAKDAQTLLRYQENRFSAATGFRKEHKVVVFGFPFEAIQTSVERELVLQAVLRYLQ